MMPPSDEALSERHLLAIGRMVVEVSRLELQLVDLGAILMGVDTMTAITAIGPQQFANKVDTLKAFVNWRLNGHVEHAPALAVLNATKAVNDRRNTVVHAFWVLDEDGVPLAVRLSARGEINRARTPMTAEKVEVIAQDALAARQTLAQLLDRLHAQS